MKRIVTLLVFLILCFFSCSHNKQRIHYFDRLSPEKTLQDSNVIVCSLTFISENEEKISVKGPSMAAQYDYLEKIIEHKGIYRKLTNEYILNYRLDSLGKGIFNIEGNGRGLLSEDIIFNGKKNYTLNNREIEIYRFDEATGSGGFTSYYVINFGFIAYVSSGYGYYLCTRIKGHDYFSHRELREIGDILTSDTTFFAIYNYRNLPD